MTLLTDGSVLALRVDATGRPRLASREWLRLFPDLRGSYWQSTWRRTAPARTPRVGTLARAVPLLNGRVLVWGGSPSGVPPDAELYDPASDTWFDATPDDRSFIEHTGPSTVLPDGRVLVGSSRNLGGGRYSRRRTAIYSPSTNLWSAAPDSTGDWQRAWTLLADGSVFNASGFERFEPSSGSWNATTTPGALFRLQETQPALRLPDSRIWVILPNTHRPPAYPRTPTGFYVPAAGGTPEQWSPGPNLPRGVFAYFFSDANPNTGTACLLPDGRVFLQARRTWEEDAPGSVGDSSRLYFYVFEPGSGTFAEEIPPAVLEGVDIVDAGFYSFASTLLLPDGTVLVSRNSVAFVYDPEPGDRRPRAEWRPAIHHLDAGSSLRPSRTYTMAGELFAGVSEANNQPESHLATNFPLLRIRYDDGEVRYWRTFAISSRAVGVAGVTQTFQFQVPTRTRLGHVRLSVVANAIASDEIEAEVEISNRYWLWQTLYRDDSLLIGNLADGGYIIVRPGGVQPVGPWDPALLKQLDVAVQDVRAAALGACSDWKRITELPPGSHLTIALASGELQEGRFLRVDPDTLTIVADTELITIKREVVLEAHATFSGGDIAQLAPRGLSGAGVLVYVRPAPPANAVG